MTVSEPLIPLNTGRVFGGSLWQWERADNFGNE